MFYKYHTVETLIKMIFSGVLFFLVIGSLDLCSLYAEYLSTHCFLDAIAICQSQISVFNLTRWIPKQPIQNEADTTVMIWWISHLTQLKYAMMVHQWWLLRHPAFVNFTVLLKRPILQGRGASISKYFQNKGPMEIFPFRFIPKFNGIRDIVHVI